jgi:transposase
VDTDVKTVQVSVPSTKQRRRTIQDRRQIVEETLQTGASVSRVARRYDVNANQVFYWRKLYRESRLGGSTVARLLPVKVSRDPSVEAEKSHLTARLGTMEVMLSKGTLRITGAVDLVALQAVLECLAR